MKEQKRKIRVRLKPASALMSTATDDARTLQEQGRGEVPSDTLGSYTGTPEDGLHPVQDADDL